jgi:hypothetical protein
MPGRPGRANVSAIGLKPSYIVQLYFYFRYLHWGVVDIWADIAVSPAGTEPPMVQVSEAGAFVYTMRDLN